MTEIATTDPVQPELPLYRSILDCLHDGVYLVDRDRRITYWNRAAEVLTGFAASEAVGTFCSNALLCHVDAKGTQLCHGHCPLAATISDGQSRSVDVFLHHKEGHRVPVNVRAAPLRDASGAIVGAVESFSDNSARVSALDRIRELERTAYVDATTGLPNRRYAEMLFAERLRDLESSGRGFAVAFADLDGFKAINDRYGHDVGDKVLASTGATLLANLRSLDIAARWGGDEFVMLLPQVDRDQLQGILERLRALVMSSFVRHELADVRASVSVGGVLARAGDTMESLLSRADALMYDSKRAGRNRVTVE